MQELKARFSLLDDMSAQIERIAEAGMQMVEQFEDAGSAAGDAFDGIESGVATAAGSVDGVATSIGNVQEATDSAAAAMGDYGNAATGAAGQADALANSAESAAEAAESFTDAADGYGNAAEQAASQTDYWTAAVGNYDKSALEAVYSTEELVEMGFKSADALEEQERMFELCDQSASNLSKSMEATTDIQAELNATMEQAADVMTSVADNENVSAETKAELAKAAEEAAEAMAELNAAQQDAEAAMSEYDAVMASGTTDLGELESAAERAGIAAENLAAANGRASDATEELSKATEQASEEAEKAEKKGTDAVEGIAQALAAAGITAAVKEITDSAYELVEAFSEAESTVVKATGASGEALDGLTASMMDAYAASKSGSLDDTAGAIGEINTRMALTGEELTKVTGQFLDYAEITGTNVVGSVQNVTKIMNKWGVEATDVESVLDKLAYAGQISGISVDSLSSTLITGSASLQEMGLSLDNAISLLANLELYGMNSTTVVTAMRTAVKNFSADGLDAQTALQSTITEIANMENAADATALAIDTFGSRAGVDMANAIRSGAISIETLTGNLDVAQGTLSSTAETAQTLDQKWEQASKNINSAFTTTVQPTVDKLSSGFADLANSVGDFLNDHPTVTKAITAIGVGAGTVAVAIAGVAFATSSAIPAIVSFGVSLNAALGPIGWVALGITAVTAAVAAFVAMSDDEQAATERLTYSAREHEATLEQLNAEYDEAVSKYGASSEQAGELAVQISRLEAAYGDAGKTIGQFIEEIEQTGEAIADIQTKYDDAVTSASDLEKGSMNLASQLMVLSSQSDITSADLDLMSGIVDKLNDNYGELSLAVDKTTGKLNMSVPELYSFIQEKADEQKKTAATDALTEAISKYGEARKQMQDASTEVGAAWDNYQEMTEKWRTEHPIKAYLGEGAEMNWDKDLGQAFDDWEALKDASAEASENYNQLEEQIRQYCETLGYTTEETDEFISQLEASADSMNSLSDATQSAEEDTLSYQEAVSTAYDGVRSKVEELCTAYDEAYAAALESFQGQFGLFDEASTTSEEYMNATVANAQAAMDSQLAYWDTYLSNVETLKSVSAEDLGVTQENYEALMAYAQSGTEEAAGLAASMADAINSGNTEAVAALANTVGEVQAKQEEASQAVADWQTNFTASLGEIEQEMSTAIEGMDLSEEAQASAKATISAYIEQISSSAGEASKAAEGVVEAIRTALSSAENDAKVNVDVEYKPNTESLDNLTIPEKTGEAKYEIDTSQIEAYTMPDTSAEAEYKLNSTIVDNYTPEDKEADAIYDVNSLAVDNWRPPNKTATLTYNITTSGSVPGHANGTTNAESLFLAGENGPELVARPAAAYANGTTDSTDYFIAGENGPELIIGEQGSTVFPTEETDRLIGALNDREKPLRVRETSGSSTGKEKTSEDVKRILLEIAGSGAIEIGGNGGADKETILEVLYDHLKPVLMNIIQSEIYEEGELSYEY